MKQKPTREELTEELKTKSVDTVANTMARMYGWEDVDKPIKLSNTERLACLTAMEKAIKEQIKQVRAEVDEELIHDFYTTGSDRRNLRINKKDVGTISVRKAKGKYVVEDQRAFDEFLILNGLGRMKYTFNSVYSNQLKHILDEAGDYDYMFDSEVIPNDDFEKLLQIVDDETLTLHGTDFPIPGIVPAETTATGTMVRGCKPEDVLPILLNGPKRQIEALLTGGGEHDEA